MTTSAAQDKLRKPLSLLATDPRGNIVICAQSVWDGHIAKYHPEMKGRIGDIESALVDPDAIRQSKARPNAEIFEWIAADTMQIRVAVTFDVIALAPHGQTMGKVNSAYPVDPIEYDTPNVGNYIYLRAATSRNSPQEREP